MSKARIKNTSSKTKVPSAREVTAQINPITGRIIDPRVVAWGRAEMAVCMARDELSASLRALGIEPNPIIDVLSIAHQKAGDMIERALARRAAPCQRAA